MQSVREFAKQRGFSYHVIGDELFDGIPEDFRGFHRVTLTDLGRLQHIYRLIFDYDHVYWIDSDLLIWGQDFQLPEAKPGAVVCCREGWYTRRPRFGVLDLKVNNSIIGFRSPEDVRILLKASRMKLCDWYDRELQAPMTVIGTDLFTSPEFPLRRIEMKSAACFSPDSIWQLLDDVSRHLFWLGLANGAAIQAANLCSSREIPEQVMEAIVKKLRLETEALPTHRWATLSPIFRVFQRLVRQIDRIRYCLRATPVKPLIRNSRPVPTTSGSIQP